MWGPAPPRLILHSISFRSDRLPTFLRLTLAVNTFGGIFLQKFEKSNISLDSSYYLCFSPSFFLLYSFFPLTQPLSAQGEGEGARPCAPSHRTRSWLSVYEFSLFCHSHILEVYQQRLVMIDDMFRNNFYLNLLIVLFLQRFCFAFLSSEERPSSFHFLMRFDRSLICVPVPIYSMIHATSVKRLSLQEKKAYLNKNICGRTRGGGERSAFQAHQPLPRTREIYTDHQVAGQTNNASS